jgi:hypothetical protein
MKFEVNVRKKFAFMILGAILILAGVIYGYAYGGNVPDVMGHSGNEIYVEFNGQIELLNNVLDDLSDGTGSGGSVIHSLPNGPVILKNGEDFSQDSVAGTNDEDRIIERLWWNDDKTYKLSQFPFTKSFSSILPNGLSSEITHIEITTLAKYKGDSSEDRLFVYATKGISVNDIYPLILFNEDDDGNTWGTDWATSNRLIPIDDWNGQIKFYQDNQGVSTSQDRILFIVTGYVTAG